MVSKIKVKCHNHDFFSGAKFKFAIVCFVDFVRIIFYLIVLGFFMIDDHCVKF